MAKSENWSPVAGYEGIYEVSDQGSVRSLERTVLLSNGASRKFVGKVLKPGVDGNGRYYVNLNKNGSVKKGRIHVLVAEAFIGPRREGQDVCHNNGDRLDNRAENLRYDTRSENLKDMQRHGTSFWSNKTECPQGHEYTPENTRINSRGSRVCRECDRITSRNYHHNVRKVKS